MSTAAIVAEAPGLRLHLFRPAPALAPYITLYYRTEVIAKEPVEDCLPPEWANLRAGRGTIYEAAVGSAPLEAVPLSVLSGPTSRATRLRIAQGDFWGVGLLPLGFAQFVRASAGEYADGFRDLTEIAALGHFHEILETVIADPSNSDRAVATFDTAFQAMLAKPVRASEMILDAHESLLSDDMASVAALQSALGMGNRTLERFCRRHFGFSPRLLLRRQRFLRSVSRFLVDPSLKWIGSLDSHYYDQAQFVREFRAFMGMRPREYATMAHPITLTALRARSELLGPPMQILHPPANSPVGSPQDLQAAD